MATLAMNPDPIALTTAFSKPPLFPDPPGIDPETKGASEERSHLFVDRPAQPAPETSFEVRAICVSITYGRDASACRM